MKHVNPNVASPNLNMNNARRFTLAATTAAALLMPAACSEDNGAAEKKSSQTTQEVAQTTTPEQARGEVASKVFDFASILMNIKSDIVLKSTLVPNEENLLNTVQHSVMIIKPGETNPTQVLNIFTQPKKTVYNDNASAIGEKILKVEILNFVGYGSSPENPSSSLIVDASQSPPIVEAKSQDGNSFEMEIWDLDQKQISEIDEIYNTSRNSTMELINSAY
jgi:hypothetical protein